MKIKLLGLMLIAVLGSESNVFGQQIQQPVIRFNNVQTTVSVPDRGSALLGGVARARSGSNQYGFSPFGSSVGRGVSNGSQRAFVTIHDFEEIDRQVLAIGREQRAARAVMKNPRAVKAWKQLSKNR